MSFICLALVKLWFPCNAIYSLCIICSLPILPFWLSKTKRNLAKFAFFLNFSLSTFGFPIWQTNCGVNLISDGCHRLVGFICPPILNSLAKLLISNKSKNHPFKSASTKLSCSPQLIFASCSIWYCINNSTISCKGRINIELNWRPPSFGQRVCRNNC